jgi:NAD(P)-dependent dehydrogenase (short-subunit alcohol dehydrogenase family)
MQNPSGKIALITGANKGIGFEVARQLAKSGCTVFLGARNPDLGRQAASKLQKDNLDVRFIELDLGRSQTIRGAAASIANEFQRLDILVNNAGIAMLGSDGPPSVANLEAVQNTMQTNFLGALAVTQAVLPLLRKSSAGRIVNVSSGLGSLTLHSNPKWEYASIKPIGYGASKAAMNMFTVQLAWELRDTTIKVNSADPGYTATDLNGHSGTQTVEEGAAETVRLSLLPEDGPTGGFFRTAGPDPW